MGVFCTRLAADEYNLSARIINNYKVLCLFVELITKNERWKCYKV